MSLEKELVQDGTITVTSRRNSVFRLDKSEVVEIFCLWNLKQKVEKVLILINNISKRGINVVEMTECKFYFECI